MRRLGLKALAWSALAMATAGAAAGTGCKGTQPTELVPGVSTQMVVTKDLDTIRIDVESNGEIVFCRQYDVAPDGVVQLPSTLGVLHGTSGGLVTITIRGYDVPGTAGGDINNCTSTETGTAAVDAPANPDGSGTGPRIIRRSIQSYVDGHVLFLPMPLSYSCQDVDCSMRGPTYACQGGQCVDQMATTPSTLADYDPSLYDGLGLCFSPMNCLADAEPAALLDPERCIYGFPSWDTPLVGTGANVRIFYKDVTWQPNPAGGYEQVLAEAGEEEILNEDSVEGFTVMSATGVHLPEAGQTLPGVDAGPIFNTSGPLIQLAPGLCDLAKAATTPPPHPASGSLTYHTISDIQVASACPPKETLLPICASERNNSAVLPDSGTTTGACNVAIPMDPAPSAMYLVMDQSVYMHGAYGAAGSAQALAVSLTDPVFKQTFAAFKYLNDPGELDCSAAQPSSYLTPTLPFNLAGIAQPQIATKLSAWTASETGTGTCTGQGTSLTNGCGPGAPYCYLQQCYAPFPLDLQGAMLGTGAYQEIETFLTQSQISSPNIAGVMFIVNRAPISDVVSSPATPPEAQDCPGPVPATTSPGCNGLLTAAADECTSLTNIETEAQNALSMGIRTYFVVLGNDDNSLEPITFFNQVAADVPQAVTTLDATMLNSVSTGVLSSMAMGDVASFLQSITQLGTCLYQLPPDVAPGTAAQDLQVTFSVPGAPPGAPGTTTIVKAVSDCTAASEASGTSNGWSYDGTDRVRLCGTPCTTLRNYVIAAAATEADVPVTIANLCSGTKSVPTTESDASTGGAPDATTGAADSGTSAGPCGPATCMFGCCEGNQCLPGDQDNACGSGGLACQDCGVGVCNAGTCPGGSAEGGVTADGGP